MTTKEQILAYLAGETDALPATKTEEERLLAKAAERISAGLLPVPAAPASADAASADAGKIPTVQDDGTYELAALQENASEPTT